MSLTKATYSMISGAPVNVLDYGAVGDGVTDDTAAIQAAIASGAGKVWLPDGTYLVSSLTFTASNFELAGTNKSIIKGKSSLSSDVISATNCDNVVFSGFVIDGNKTGRTGGKPVYFGTSNNITISGCEIKNAYHYSIQCNDCNNVKIIENDIYDGDESGIDVRITSAICSEVIISNNAVYNVGGTGIQFWGGDAATAAALPPLGGDYIGSLTITGNTVYGCTAGGIFGSRGFRVSIAGNTVRDCDDVGIDTEGCSVVAVSGNTVQSCANGGITTFYGTSYLAVTGNSVFQGPTQGPCVRVYPDKPSDRITISGNSLRHDGSDNLILFDGTATVNDYAITGNVGACNTGTSVDVFNGDYGVIDANQFNGNGDYGIRLRGTSNTQISNNFVFSTGAIGTGISLDYLSDPAYPTTRNNVKQNVVLGFSVAIRDSFGGTAGLAYSWISGNRCSMGIKKWAAGNSLFADNYSNDLVAITPTNI